MSRTLPLVFVLILAAHAEARYCNNPSCAMCNRLFGPMSGFEPRPLKAIDSTPHEIVKVMVEALNLTSSDLMYDLGCGDGRALIEAVRQSNCRASGVEIDPQVAAIAKDNVRRSGLGHRIRVTNADATRYNEFNCTALFIYMTPPLIVKLLPKLKPSTRIVSYMHPLPGIPCRIIRAPNGAPIYVSIVDSWKW